MQFTLSTAPLLVLAIYLCYLSKGQLLPVVMFMSVFQAASIMNLTFGGSISGVSPAFFILGFAIFKQLATRPDPACKLHPPRRSTTMLLVSFFIYSAFSVLVYPGIFKGITFTNPKFGKSATLLAFSPGFLPQLLYLAACLSLYLVASYRTTPAELSKSLNWFTGGAVLAACIAIYQYAGTKTGLPFPSEYLHTNPTYSIFEAYEVDGFSRMNSTFTEAAGAAFYFATALAVAAWKLLSGSITWKKVLIAFLIFAGLFLTVSSTGYVCLLFIIVVVTWVYFSRSRGAAKFHVERVLAAAPVLALMLLILANSHARQSINKLAHTVLLDKQGTASYKEREQRDLDALHTAAHTHWLGAGFGVCRGSSILPTMLGNVGIAGVLMFWTCAMRPFLLLLKPGSVRGVVHGAVLFSFATALLALLVSGPETTAPVIWLLLALTSRLRASSPRAVFNHQFIPKPHAVSALDSELSLPLATN